MNQPQQVSIYVLPSERDMPPRAILYSLDIVKEGEEGKLVEMDGALVTWSRDSSAWLTPDGLPVEPDLGEAITAHAKSLGVEW